VTVLGDPRDGRDAAVPRLAETASWPAGAAHGGPGNPIGWLYGAAGLAWAYTIPVQPWIDQLVREHRPLPLVTQLVAATGDLSWAPAIGLGVTLPALLLPNGHLRSRRWRLVVITSVTGLVLITVAGPLAPGPLEEMGIDNPFGLAGPAGTAAGVLTIVGVLLHWWSLPPAAVCVLLRFRSSRGRAAAAALGRRGIAGAVAVLRYRLYDLDRIVSRSLGYGPLTVLLGLGYAGVVLGLGRLLPDSSDLVAAATLAAVAAFSPLHRRVPPASYRRFNRRRYDAGRTVEGFAARLRDQVDLDALHGELLAVVDQTMQPTRASLWLRHVP
jgi:hypothetical protein